MPDQLHRFTIEVSGVRGEFVSLAADLLLQRLFHKEDLRL
jgi:hypothetical protein